MNPFIYPKVQHVRKLTPKKQFKRYQSYKRFLRLEFAGRCIYCQMPSSLRGYESFGVDHYRPKKQFPQLSAEYANLYYCCSACNSAKGSYWPATMELEKTKCLPNPCDYKMFDHLRFRGARIEAKSTQGQVALKLLDLNDAASIDYREFVLETVATWAEKKALLNSKRQKAEKKAKAGALSATDAAAAIAKIDAALASADKWLKTLSGDPT